MRLKDKFEVTAPRDYFRNSLVIDGTGKTLNVHDSIQHICDTLSGQLRDISDDNEFNGEQIKAGKRSRAYEEALQPVLIAAADLMAVVCYKEPSEQRHQPGYKQNGYGTVSIQGKDINLVKVEESLVAAVNSWFGAVQQDKQLDINDVGFPFPHYDSMREELSTGIERITEVLVQQGNGEYVPRVLLSNNDAQKITCASRLEHEG